MRTLPISKEEEFVFHARKMVGDLKKPSVEYFEEGPFGHHYYQNPDTKDVYTGTTTISGAWKKDFLQAWYAKEAVKALGYFDVRDFPTKVYGWSKMTKEEKEKVKQDAWSNLLAKREQMSTMTPEELLKFFEIAKGAAKELGKVAADNGTAAHAQMQSYVEHQLDPSRKIEKIEMSSESQNAYDAFLGFVAKKNIIWLASEELVCSDVYKLAGTLDGIAIIDGNIFLVDFKTSSQLSEDYILQTGGYDIMLREMGLRVDGYLIIRTPKDGKDVETLTITDESIMQFARETFLHLREAHRFFVYAENQLKSGEGFSRKIKVDEKPIEKSEEVQVEDVMVVGPEETETKKITVHKK